MISRSSSLRIFAIAYLCLCLINAKTVLATGPLSINDPLAVSRCDAVYDQPSGEACAYVRSHCSGSLSGFLDYRDFYFCRAADVKPLAVIILFAWLAFLFGFIGIAASEFFSPNLGTIASSLHMSESLTGVTFLALGNGSPDLFATFSAMRAMSGSLAVGELLGAAAFIVSVVAGSMALISPFKVPKVSFLRDVGFFCGAVIFLVIILADGRLQLWESFALMGYYVIYVLAVAVSTLWIRRGKRKQQQLDQARFEYTEHLEGDTATWQDEEEEIEYTETDLLLPQASQDSSDDSRSDLSTSPILSARNLSRSSSRMGSMLPRSHYRPSLLGAMEFQDVLYHLKAESRSSTLHPNIVVSPNGGLRPRRHSTATLRTYGNPDHARPQRHKLQLRNHTTEGTGVRLEDQVSRSWSPINTDGPHNRFLEDPWRDPQELTFSRSPIDMIPEISISSPVPNESHNEDSEGQGEPSRSEMIRSAFKVVRHEMLPTFFPALCSLRSKSFAAIAVSIGVTPAIFVLRCTLPVVDENDLRDKLLLQKEQASAASHGDHQGDRMPVWQKWLLCLQVLIAPLFMLFTLQPTSYRLFLYPLAAAMGVLACTFTSYMTTPYKISPSHKWICFMGFIVAIFWIYTLANEVVGVLQTIGQILGMSDAILGLTIFAVGNSSADLVANIAVARMGYPVMALSACFGGPMLNILLGIGIGGAFMTASTGGAYAFDLSPTLIVTAATLLVVLIATMIVAPIKDYYLDRTWGLALIGVYIASMIINILVEVFGL